MENSSLQKYHLLFIKDVNRRIFEENHTRIKRCLKLITEEQLWYKHNENVNSIGNLILHICGNIRQYIVAGIFQKKDERERDLEFSNPGTFSKSEILLHLQNTLEEVRSHINDLSPEMLIKEYEVQGFQENGVSILIHVTEHFSYHVGQITYLTKYLNNVDTGYYAGKDLNAKSN